MRHWADLTEEERSWLCEILRPGESIRRPKRWIPPERIIAYYRECLDVPMTGWKATMLTAARFRVHTETVRRTVRRNSHP